MRYHNSLHPRQSVRCGGLFTSSSGHYPTFALYNNGSGPYVLMVRYFAITSSASAFVQCFFTQSNPITTATSAVPSFTTEAAPTGLVGFYSAASETTGDSALVAEPNSTAQWPGPIPFCVLTPGWAINFQGNTPAAQISVLLVYEWLRQGQMDEEALLQANLNILANPNGQP